MAAYKYIIYYLLLVFIIFYGSFNNVLELDVIIFLSLFATFVLLIVEYYVFNTLASKSQITKVTPIPIEPSIVLPLGPQVPQVPLEDNQDKYVDKWVPLVEIISYSYKLLKSSYSYGVLYSGGYTGSNISQMGGQGPNANGVQVHNANGGRVHNAKGVQVHNAKSGRVHNAKGVHSGDIINIYNGNNIIQRKTDTNNIICQKQLLHIKTNLSKLRLEKNNNYDPLHYGDFIYIKHNVYEDYKNQTKYITHYPKLTSHQTDNSYGRFQIFDATNIFNIGIVEYEVPIILCSDNTISENKYLRIDKDGQIYSDAKIKKAAHFTLELVLKSNKDNNHLIIKPNEILHN
jgi:hypothetical protein